MTNKHTPGPWKFSNDLILDQDNNIVADILHNTENRCVEKIRYDKYLISAAPDLLEALQGVMLWLVDENIEAKKQGRTIHPYEHGLKALKKARGIK